MSVGPKSGPEHIAANRGPDVPGGTSYLASEYCNGIPWAAELKTTVSVTTVFMFHRVQETKHKHNLNKDSGF